MNKYLTMALAAVLLSSPATVHAEGIGGELDIARADERWGAELGLGYGFSAGPFTIRPIAGALLYHKENPRYRWETFSNGRQQCRDLSNGQFADSLLCNETAALAYGKVEAAYSVPMGPEVGVGARLSGHGLQPYAIAGISMLPKVRANISAGEHFVALGLRAGF